MIPFPFILLWMYLLNYNAQCNIKADIWYLNQSVHHYDIYQNGQTNISITYILQWNNFCPDRYGIV